MTEQDKSLLKKALQNSYGEKIIGELGEYEFLRNVECTGKVNQGRAIQLITDYIIWSHGCPKLSVSPNAYIPSHPFQEFVRNNRELILIVPEVIEHYVTSQGWKLDAYGIDKEIAEYIPQYVEREVNIE